MREISEKQGLVWRLYRCTCTCFSRQIPGIADPRLGIRWAQVGQVSSLSVMICLLRAFRTPPKDNLFMKAAFMNPFHKISSGQFAEKTGTGIRRFLAVPVPAFSALNCPEKVLERFLLVPCVRTARVSKRFGLLRQPFSKVFS